MHPDECRYCPACSHLCMVEIPDMADGDKFGWPERACVECGAALFVDPVTRARPAATRAA